MKIKLEDKYLNDFINPREYYGIAPQIKTAHELLHSGHGLGSDYTGWLQLPKNYNKQEFQSILDAAKKIQEDTDVFVVIGIGGSYLGARAAIEFLSSQNYNSLPKKTPSIYFIGNSISPMALSETLKLCEGKRVSINVISKSGTTTEPAIAFKVFREFLENQYGKEEASKRIYCTTDRAKGTLKKLADDEGYETFVIPENIGGRYSVLTPVGLLPIAVSGADILNIMEGAAKAHDDFLDDRIDFNICYKYAAIRNILFRKGKLIEILASYEPRFALMSEWFKQLFGESEGKDQKGVFLASVIFSTDLHSMGQLIQDGSRNIFETVLFLDNVKQDIIIKEDPQNMDGLNFLAGKTMSYVNQKAFEGTVIAHTDGGVPNVVLHLPDVSEDTLGYLVYFFEKACAISGYTMGTNPFDQPGVESYKKNMFALLEKPGFSLTNR
ncbi:MAG: glucose-6-phosphate isomerase [Oscillospiraceae bacterium]|nr:glucose-6-phosphate isomerase [Oscillospiraceae bacterium]